MAHNDMNMETTISNQRISESDPKSNFSGEDNSVARGTEGQTGTIYYLIELVVRICLGKAQRKIHEFFNLKERTKDGGIGTNKKSNDQCPWAYKTLICVYIECKTNAITGSHDVQAN